MTSALSLATTSNIAFDQFCRAVMGLVHESCCAAPSLSVVRSRPAQPMRQNSLFKRLGRDAWTETVSTRDSILPTIRGAFVLPDVTIAHMDRPDAVHVDVYVVDGRIDSITPAGAMQPPPQATVFEEARGGFVASALIDMHVHMPPDSVLRLTDLFLLQTLRHGITVLRDAGDTDGTATPAALASVVAGALPGPEIHYAYGFVNSPPARWSNSFGYADPEQAPGIIDRLRHLGATWVKSYENLDVPRIVALKAAARAAGMGVLGHVPYGLGHEDAQLPDGQHLFGMAPPASIRRDHVFNRMIDWDAVDDRRIDLVRQVSADRGLAVTPTLNTSTGVLDLERHHQARDEPTARALPSFYSAIVWHPRHGIPAYRDIRREDFDRCRRAVERKHLLVNRLFGDGVPLRLGTDTQQPFVAPGIALHRELEAFEQAGIPRRDSWRLATATAASALGLTDIGTVDRGARAELVVTRSDPRHSSWSVSRDLTATVAKGTLITAADLDVAIGKELARFEGAFGEFTTRLLARLTMRRLARNFVS
ncbi:amidohydrolase family protein [Nocardia sp. SC052]|uniref:amidohydrolase family protein n=1 Tax=Nocardia sichangensis TaxID=3385975 RepID=UPI00399FCCB6